MLRGLLAAALPAALIFSAGAQAAGLSAAGWGFNGKGELGARSASNVVLRPMPVPGVSPIKEVVTTSEWSMALLGDGTVETWGGNRAGQLGDGSTEAKQAPVTVRIGPVKQIAAAGEHAIALMADGTVEVWGSNLFGQLGNGTDGGAREGCLTLCRSSVPVPVAGLSGVSAVAAGGASDAALLGNGTLEAWGENKTGQLGDGTTAEKDSPTLARVSGVTSVAIGGEATLGGHTLVLLGGGAVEAVGFNGHGELGVPPTNRVRTSFAPVAGLPAVSALSASWTHSLALSRDGTVRAWGNDARGELGVRARLRCGRRACVVGPELVPALHDVTAVSAGYAFSLAVSSGSVYSWGQNNFGQLGNGTRVGSLTPRPIAGVSQVSGVSAGNYSAMALTALPLQ